FRGSGELAFVGRCEDFQKSCDFALHAPSGTRAAEDGGSSRAVCWRANLQRNLLSRLQLEVNRFFELGARVAPRGIGSGNGSPRIRFVSAILIMPPPTASFAPRWCDGSSITAES